MNVLAGDATIAQMYDLNMVRTPADLYDLSMTRLLSLDGWKEKSARRFLDSLHKSVEVPFERVLYALGIRYVGEQTAKEIARHFGDIDSIASASEVLPAPSWPTSAMLRTCSGVGAAIRTTIFHPRAFRPFTHI